MGAKSGGLYTKDENGKQVLVSRTKSTGGMKSAPASETETKAVKKKAAPRKGAKKS